MASAIVLQLPDGMSKVLTLEEAYQTVEQLWGLGLDRTPGAVLCAVRILEVLQAPSWHRCPSCWTNARRALRVGRSTLRRNYLREPKPGLFSGFGFCRTARNAQAAAQAGFRRTGSDGHQGHRGVAAVS